MGGETVKRTRTTSGRPAVDEAVELEHVGQMPESQTSETGEKLKAELDSLLDEIDDVLETNAEDFVKSYVQKGGE